MVAFSIWQYLEMRMRDLVPSVNDTTPVLLLMAQLASTEGVSWKVSISATNDLHVSSSLAAGTRPYGALTFDGEQAAHVTASAALPFQLHGRIWLVERAA